MAEKPLLSGQTLILRCGLFYRNVPPKLTKHYTTLHSQSIFEQCILGSSGPKSREDPSMTKSRHTCQVKI